MKLNNGHKLLKYCYIQSEADWEEWPLLEVYFLFELWTMHRHHEISHMACVFDICKSCAAKVQEDRWSNVETEG